MHNAYRGGTPDCFYCGGRSVLWVEYKWLAKTPVRRFSSGLSALQRAWIFERGQEGVNVCVAIGCPDGVAAFWGIGIFVATRDAETFRKALIPTKSFVAQIERLVGAKYQLTEDDGVKIF